ncbi:MAG TPA: serine hydrolase [Niabella sp.]|nr:serine hydrolase [Niabella sp.]
MKKLTFKPFAALALTVSLIACQKNELIKTSGKEFDLDLFEENIKKALADKTIGFSYSISQNGVQKRKGADGAAVASWDSRSGAEIAHAPVKRQDLASCSKTYTALTVMRLLQEKKLTHKELLIDYLPSFWKKPAWSFNEITLGMLMNHTSGLIDGWLDYSALKQKTEGGGIFLHGGYKYVNANYAFLRVAIAYLSHESDLKKLENTYLKNPSNASEKALETAINDYYIEQVNQKVFAKCGIPYTYPKPDGEMNPTMNYNFNTKDPGWNKGDMTLHAGSAG